MLASGLPSSGSSGRLNGMPMSVPERTRGARPPASRPRHWSPLVSDYDVDLVPDSLTIHLARGEEPNPYWKHYDFEATSPEFPGLSGTSSSPESAVEDL